MNFVISVLNVILSATKFATTAPNVIIVLTIGVNALNAAINLNMIAVASLVSVLRDASYLPKYRR